MKTGKLLFTLIFLFFFIVIVMFCSSQAVSDSDMDTLPWAKGEKLPPFRDHLYAEVVQRLDKFNEKTKDLSIVGKADYICNSMTFDETTCTALLFDSTVGLFFPVPFPPGMGPSYLVDEIFNQNAKNYQAPGVFMEGSGNVKCGGYGYIEYILIGTPSVYIGELKNCVPHGHGAATAFKTGAHYVGEFTDGIVLGQGKTVMPDGSYFIGEFRSNKAYTGIGAFSDGRQVIYYKGRRK